MKAEVKFERNHFDSTMIMLKKAVMPEGVALLHITYLTNIQSNTLWYNCNISSQITLSSHTHDVMGEIKPFKMKKQ